MTFNEAHPEFLFSYGTLQLEAVQMATFGRQLTGTSDALRGFELVSSTILNCSTNRKLRTRICRSALLTIRASTSIAQRPSELRRADSSNWPAPADKCATVGHDDAP
jgi:hypothetical protein